MEKVVDAHTTPYDKPSEKRLEHSGAGFIEQDSTNSEAVFDLASKQQKALLRKMDRRLIPVLALLYFMSFLDRGSVGNAKILGLTSGLNLVGNQYNWCLTVFFFTYCACEVPSNLMLKWLKPSVWLPLIMIIWGTITTLTGIVRSYHGLLAIRIFLGISEAGLYPGVAFYLTFWYSRAEISFRQALFFSAASLAGAFSGLLAFAISKMDGIGGLDGWRWIFILEGIMTVLVAVISFFVIYDNPGTAAFLTPTERVFIIHKLRYQGSVSSQPGAAPPEELRWQYIKAAFQDWQVYVAAVMNIGIGVPLFGISLFLPTIVNELGYTATTAQLLTVPIYSAAAVCSVTTAYFSDRAQSRFPFVFGSLFTAFVGLIITITASSHGGVPGVVYAGILVTVCGLYPAFPANVTWLANNLAGSSKRGVGMAIHIAFGNMGGAIASNLYRPQDAPKFLLALGIDLGFIFASLLAAIAMRIVYARINKKRDRVMDDGPITQDVGFLGDRAPTFRYML